MVRLAARGAALVLGALALLVAVVEWSLVSAELECPLGMEFERATSTVVESRSVPPRVTCRYTFVEGQDGESIAPPDTRTLDAAPTVLASSSVAALAIGAVVALRPRPRAGAQYEHGATSNEGDRQEGQR
jgi:hypothetical protein